MPPNLLCCEIRSSICKILSYRWCCKFLLLCVGGDFDCHSKIEGLNIIEYKELVEIYCLVSIFPKDYSSVSIVYRSYKNFWHTH